MPGRAVRSEFSKNEDILLTKFIATYNPAKQGRGGNTLYKRLVDNVDGKWNWSETHSWQSWRNRYAKNSDEFDRKILKYQKKKGIDPRATEELNKPASPRPNGQKEATRVRSKRAGDQIFSPQREAKRVKLDTNQPGGARSRFSPVEAEPTSLPPASGSSKKASSPLHTQEQAEVVSAVPPPTQKPESKLNIPPLPARSGTLPLPSSQSDSPLRTQPPTTSQLPPSSQPLASSSQRVATPKPPSSVHKLILKPKPKSNSPFFRSFSPTPDYSIPPKTTPPKVVKGHFTTSLTDRLGHARPAYQSESEEEETEPWPPIRGKKGKEKEVVPGLTVVSSSAVQQHEHHPISRVDTAISRPASVLPKRESEDQQARALNCPEPDHHPFSQVSLPPPPPPPSHSRAGADMTESPLKHRSTNGVRELVQSLRDRKTVVVTGPSTSSFTPALPLVQPVAGPLNLKSAAVTSGSVSTIELPPERVVVGLGAPSLNGGNTSISARISARPAENVITPTPILSKGDPTLATKLHPVVPLPGKNSHSGAPASRSNIQPGPSLLFVSSEDKGKAKRRDANLPLTHAQRLPTRIRKQRRRQTHGGYEYDGVPSIDLSRAHSAASTSRIPTSKGSTSSSVSRLLHRYSLPAHSTPSAVRADLSGYINTLEQPSPTILPVPPTLITPVDVPLSASIGFSTLISRIAAAHGYMPSVVLEVYKRLGNLKEVEEFVKAMRNAAEEWVEAEFERRERETRGTSRRQNRSDSSKNSESNDDAPRGGPSFNTVEHRTPNGLHVRYVPPPDVSDYEPPPTSRAARWKRASMGGVGSLNASWGTIDAGRYRTTKQEVTEHMMEGEYAVDSSEGDDNTSAEEDGVTEDDLERAEEETVAEELIPGSPQEGLPEEDVLVSDPEQDAEEEPEAAYEGHSVDQDNHQGPNYQYQEFSQACHVAHVKNKSTIAPEPYGIPEHSPAPNGVLSERMDNDSDSSDAPLTHRISRSWSADEDRALLSAHWERLKELERQRGKGGMRQRVVQLLR